LPVIHRVARFNAAGELLERLERAGMDPLDLLSSDDVCQLLKVSARWLQYARDRVPGRVVIGPRAVRWRRSVLLEWIDAGCPDRQGAATTGNPAETSGQSRDGVEDFAGSR